MPKSDAAPLAEHDRERPGADNAATIAPAPSGALAELSVRTFGEKLSLVKA